MSAMPANSARSLISMRLEDPSAVYLSAKGDGVADDTAAIQAAIDEVAKKSGQGILFIPEGRYRLTRALMVWPGVRLIGFGANRPKLILAPNTPGYQDRERFMVFFTGGRSNGRVEEPIASKEAGILGGDLWFAADANPGTFYSALSNVDFEVGEGNPGAVGVRARYAQHCFLSHIDFRLESGLAAIHDAGNLINNVRFFGGRYGLLTQTPSPGWQLTVMDCDFESQTESAIYTRQTGLTLVRPSIRNVSRAVEVDPHRTEQLWMKDARLENVSEAGIVISQANSQRTQINVENAICQATPVFARFRESGKVLKGVDAPYEVEQLSHGLSFARYGAEGETSTTFRTRRTESPTPPSCDVVPLPPSDQWVNAHALGLKGDGVTDDTAALRKAIAEHDAIYLPSGKYRVSDTITLRPQTVLIGLNPITTQIVLPDATPGFGAEPPVTTRWGKRAPDTFSGGPKALIEAPKGGNCIVSGIGLDSGGNNPRAVACLWRAGERSLVDDVKFVGGHGSNTAIYNDDHTGDPDPTRKWDSQYPSLWVTDGGGGVFRGIWTASTFAQSGMLVSDTQTRGAVYEMSSEHHVRNEIQLRNCANWELIALQTEEERGEGPFCLPLEMENCENITVANLNMYRVVSVTQPFQEAVRVSGSKGVRFRNVHCYSNCKASFDNLLTDVGHGYQIRQREFTNLDLTGDEPIRKRPARPVGWQKAKIERLAQGFFNASGLATAPNGDVAFVDAKRHQIYRWDCRQNALSLVSDAPLSPVNLVFETSGDLLAVSYAGKGTVYRVANAEVLPVSTSASQPGAKFALPTSDWILPAEFGTGKPVLRPFHYRSPDGSVAISARQDFVDGNLSWGVKLQDLLRSFSLGIAEPGRPFYMTSESDMRTYAMEVTTEGNLVRPRLFAERGGESVTTDPDGNVYIAAGQVFLYNPVGAYLGVIETPERPISLSFGGPDGRTLFLTTRSALYSVRR